MTSPALYALAIGLLALERLAELVVARRNAAWSFARGGLEVGAGHYPLMVLLHSGFLLAAPAEVLFLDRPAPAAWPLLLALALLCQGLRWWCITTLGPRWNTRVIIVPGLAPITHGPYRHLRHPNYLAVVTELLVVPLLHGAWLTALVFSALNAALLAHRIRVEEAALATLPGGPS